MEIGACRGPAQKGDPEEMPEGRRQPNPAVSGELQTI